MDLLRLVLARQPLEKLLQLPGLLRSRPFVRTRSEAVNQLSGPVELEGYVKVCTLQGELSSRAVELVCCGHLRNRAVFLGQPAVYQYFQYHGEDDVDFWYALESGIPEIQAAALASLAVRTGNDKISKVLAVTAVFNDLNSIPWTPRSTELVKHVLGPVMTDTLSSPNLRNTYYLQGFLGLTGHITVDADRESYMEGAIDRILGGRVTTTRNEEIESLFTQLGLKRHRTVLYLYGPRELPVDELYEQATLCLGLKEMYEAGPDRFLDEIVQVVPITWYSIIITRRMVQRVRALIQDTAFFQLLPQSLQDDYRIIAGEVLDITGDIHLRDNVANIRTINRRLQVTAPQVGQSIQQRVFYRPDIASRDFTRQKQCFTLGMEELAENEAGTSAYWEPRWRDVLYQYDIERERFLVDSRISAALLNWASSHNRQLIEYAERRYGPMQEQLQAYRTAALQDSDTLAEATRQFLAYLSS